MPTGTIEFYAVPSVSLQNAVHPVFTKPRSAMASFNAIYLADLQQVLKVPYFDEIDNCNMVKFGGSWWWIISYETSTDQGKSIRVAVSYAPIPSILKDGSQLWGAWARTPTETSPWMQRQAINGSLKHTSTASIPHLRKFGSLQIFWVQATVQTTDAAANTVTTGRKGCFVAYGPGGSTTRLKSPIDTLYPSLNDILVDAPGVFETTSDSILDMSVSIRCPWVSGGSGQQIYLMHGSNPLAPTTTTKGAIYEVDKNLLDAVCTAFTETFSAPTYTDLEVASGTVTLRDEKTASIANFPAYMTKDFTVSVISDLTGVFTFIEGNGYRSCIPEGHIPWSGTSWEQYRAYSLAYDREAMEQSIRYSQERTSLGLAQAGASAVSNVAMGAIGGNPLSIATGIVSGAVSFGIQAWSAGEEQRISNNEARDTQALAERRAMGGPSSPYNAGYGLIYCQLNTITPAAIWLEMPDELTEDRDRFYTEWFGYPSDFIGALEISDGYLRGEVQEAGTGVNQPKAGPKWDKLIETIRTGIRIKKV